MSFTISSWSSLRRPCAALILSIAALSVGGASLPAGAYAQSTDTTVSSSAISQNFDTDETDIPIGSLVSLNKNTPSKVSLASSDNAEDLVGIVANSSLVELDDGKSVKLQVVTDGVADTLISNINGEIKIGDRIAASPVRGVGMRQTVNSQVVGIAQGSLSQAQTTSRQITSKDGTKVTIKIGRVPVRVNVSYYESHTYKETSNQNISNIPFIQRIGNAIAGHQTSTVRIAIAFILLLMGFLVMVIILRTAVASSLTSIGRNPLSADAIHKNFNAVALIALGVLLVALSTAYLALVL